MEGNYSELGSSLKQSNEIVHKQRQKSTGLKDSSEPKRRLNLSISNRQQAIQVEQQIEKEVDENEHIDTCYALAGELLGQRAGETIEDKEECESNSENNDLDLNSMEKNWEEAPNRSVVVEIG